ncbi:MAG: hypothetical protein FGM16_03985 [Flavobacterium sp.]|nr:hypothetical protein [Flavobacterium sp.]
MNNTINNLDDKWFEIRNFLPGYGHFPYVILKSGYALYMQIPIHFNVEPDVTKYPGTHINGISEADLAHFKANTNSAVHDLLIARTNDIKSKIEMDYEKPCLLCLVEGPERAYFFKDNEVNYSTAIPSGGTLLTPQNKILAMNAPHYLT